MGQYLELADKALSEIENASDRSVTPYDINDINDKSQFDPSMATEPFNQAAMSVIQRGQAVSVWSELLGEWLIWVRGETERKRLLAKGCQMPIYTLGELALVVSWPDDDIRAAHAIKKQFNGVIGAAGEPVPRLGRKSS